MLSVKYLASWWEHHLDSYRSAVFSTCGENPLRSGVTTPPHMLMGREKQTSGAMAHWSRPQTLTRLALLLLFSQNNLSPLPGFCHFYRWQSVGRSPQRVTKAVTVRHFHSLSGERQDIFESAAPLSDMAVPKALAYNSEWVGGEERATLQRPICKQNHWETFPTRHHLAATHTCLLYSLAIAVLFFFFLYL